jgi:hypothetical protein
MKIQFSIRDLLLVIAIIGITAGWLIDHHRLTTAPVRQWEYEETGISGSGGDSVQLTKEFGSQGWEVCGTYVNGFGTTIVILKRPVR